MTLPTTIAAVQDVLRGHLADSRIPEDDVAGRYAFMLGLCQVLLADANRAIERLQREQGTRGTLDMRFGDERRARVEAQCIADENGCPCAVAERDGWYAAVEDVGVVDEIEAAHRPGWRIIAILQPSECV